MVSKEKVFMISDQELISQELISKIEARSFTRIPIYSGKNRDCILWILSVKRILLA